MPESRTRALFLFGGVPALAALPAFIAAAGGESAAIAVLAQSQAGWENRPKTGHEPLLRLLEDGRAVLFAPDDAGYLDVERVCAELRQATGIFVTGGHTPTYRRLFAVEPIRTAIRDRYLAGVPYAGLSAGTLLAQETCVFPAEDYDLEQTEIVSGLGLLPGQVLEVHCETPSRMERLQANVVRLELPGIGIAQDGCAYFQDETFAQMIGGSIYFV